MYTRFVGAIALALLLLGGLAHAEVYKWTDDEGVTHYTQQPPPTEEATVLEPNIEAPSSQDSDGTQQAAQQTKQGEGSDGEDTQSIEEFCKQLREQIEVLKGDGTVKVRTGEDTLKKLEGKEREARLKRAQQQLESQCS